MQLMYVVNFRVDGANAYERVLEHVACWLSNNDTEISVDSFEKSGSSSLAPAHIDNHIQQRNGDWEVINTPTQRAVKLIVSQMVTSGLELRTRLTITEQDSETRFRIGISRENKSQSLVPVERTDIYQPGILRLLDQDIDLKLHAGNQHVNGRYIPVKSAPEARQVATILEDESRLPLALIHVRSADTWKLAEELSRKLLGLVRTVTLNYETSRVLSDATPEIAVPFGGLAVIWPGMKAQPLKVTAEQLRTKGPTEIRQLLMDRIGALAALSHGEDTYWRHAKTASDRTRMSQLKSQAETARVGGDLQGEIAALKQQVRTLKESNEFLEDLAEEAMESHSSSAQIAAERDQAREEAAMWQQLYCDLSQGKKSQVAAFRDVWAEIPFLVPASDPEATFLAISDAASDRIVFTDRARKSWAAISYPEPEDMTDKLVALARAAVQMYSGEGESFPHLDLWFKEGFGLKVALTDQTISKWKRKEMRWLNAFEHESEILDATPHVKVRDAVKPNECGRIHFALDSKKSRFVVQHVGVKTYG